ncbi:phosphotransferase [Yoonia sp. SS1-5]|uniref:Phosphotransferase n=1 Tax=Yoonia rhodophyticola TaxID=3137370 RepID=A0AAN0NK15_9RHOB
MEDAAPGLGMSHDVLANYLRDTVAGFHKLRGVTKFGTGQSNPTYKLDAESGTYVLRSKPAGKLLPSAHAVEREFRVMQALADTPVPVPPMLHLASEAVSPSGRAFFVMGFVDGAIYWDPGLPEHNNHGRAAIYDAMNATLAALHNVNVGAVGLSDFGRPGGYFSRQLERWSQQYHASAPAADPNMVAVMDWLGRHLPADDGQVALVHGDWRLDNMIFDPQTHEVKSVLDWELSTLGHPMADLAYQCMQWRLPNHGDMRGLAGLDRAALGIPSEADYVARYAQRRNLTGIDDWSFYLVFAFFRLAAILAGVAARAEAGNASNPDMARKYGAAVPALAGMARQVIKDGP